MEERVGASTPPVRRRRPARLLIPTERAGLRVTWHRVEDEFTLSLWHGDECIGSAPLTAADAGELAAFITTHLGDRARWAPKVVPDDAIRRDGPRWTLRALLRRLPGRVSEGGSPRG